MYGGDSPNAVNKALKWRGLNVEIIHFSLNYCHFTLPAECTELLMMFMESLFYALFPAIRNNKIKAYLQKGESIHISHFEFTPFVLKLTKKYKFMLYKLVTKLFMHSR